MAIINRYLSFGEFPGGNLACKELVELGERPAFGLGNHQPDKNIHEEARASPEEN